MLTILKTKGKAHLYQNKSQDGGGCQYSETSPQ